MLFRRLFYRLFVGIGLLIGVEALVVARRHVRVGAVAAVSAVVVVFVARIVVQLRQQFLIIALFRRLVRI